MLVTSYLIVWSILSFFIPTRSRKYYIIILSLILPLLYFGFRPPNDTYDLSRYYVILEYMQDMQLSDLFNRESILEYFYIGNTEYISMIYFWIIAVVGKGTKELLPYISGVIIYFSLFYLAYRAGRKYPLSKQRFAIVISYIIFVFNYGEISGIRNAIAFALAALILYMDLVENKNKYVCIILLIFLSMIHTSVFIILFFRIILLLRKVISFKLVSICCLFLYPGLNLIQWLLEKFSALPIMASLLEKAIGYSMRTEYNYRLVFGGMIIIVFVLIIATYTVKSANCFFKKYYELTVCLSAIAFGGIRIDVLFARLSNLLLFVSIPYVVYIMHAMIKNNIFVICIKNNKYKLLGVFSVLGLYVISFFFLFYNSYYLYMRTFNYFFK